MVRSSSRYGPSGPVFGSRRICWAGGAASGGKTVPALATCQGTSMATRATRRATLLFTLHSFHVAVGDVSEIAHLSRLPGTGDAPVAGALGASRAAAGGSAHRRPPGQVCAVSTPLSCLAVPAGTCHRGAG